MKVHWRARGNGFCLLITNICGHSRESSDKYLYINYGHPLPLTEEVGEKLFLYYLQVFVDVYDMTVWNLHPVLVVGVFLIDPSVAVYSPCGCSLGTRA